jgi:hypothetical protein
LEKICGKPDKKIKLWFGGHPFGVLIIKLLGMPGMPQKMETCSCDQDCFKISPLGSDSYGKSP